MKKPTIQTKYSNQDIKVLDISGKKGDVLPDHKTNFDAILKIEKGQILFTTHERSENYLTGDYKLIPAHVMHNLSFAEDSELTLILMAKSKMQFAKV